MSYLRARGLNGTLSSVVLALIAPGMGTAFAAETGGVEQGQVNEIVVTAQKRAESVQDVPVSITAVSAQTLATLRINDPSSLTQLTPGLQFGNNGGSPQPYIRGVGSDRGANNEPSVATYLDGVYIASALGALQDFYDVERVEVLRGPQGTLYGRNATGGAINIITRKPSSTLGAEAQGTIGNYNAFSGALYITGPLSDSLSASISASGRTRDSFATNVSTRPPANFKTDTTGIFTRGKLLWSPTSNFEGELSADYGHSYLSGPLRQLQSNATAFRFGGITGSEPHKVAYSDPVFHDVRQHGGRLRMALDLDFGELSSLTGYRYIRTHDLLEAGGTDVRFIYVDLNPTISKSLSHEFQLVSKAGSAFDWVLGAYYFHERQSNDPYNLFSPPAGIARSLYATMKTTSYALYGQVTIPIVDTLSIDAGGRYSWEKRSLEDRLFTNLNTNASTAYPDLSKNFKKFTYKIGINYKPTSDILVYIQHSLGFKSGIFAISAADTDPGPVNPEILYDTEGGVKMDLFDRKLRLNISAFRYKFNDLQVTVFAPGFGTTAVLRNAAKARMNGAEIELEAHPTDRLQLNATAAFLDAKYTSFPNFPLFVSNADRNGAGNRTVSTDISGTRAIRSPKFTGTFGAGYTLPLQNGANLKLNGSVYYNSGFFFSTGEQGRQDEYAVVDGSIAYQAEGGRWEFSIWAKNLLDKDYLSSTQVTSSGTIALDAPPRTFGATAKIRY